MRAVVFDWDGTLVNSQAVYVASWQVALAAVGHDASHEELRYVVGRTFPDSLQYFVRRLALEPKQVEWHWRKDYHGRLADELDVYPDALACARVFEANGIPVAIATQAPRQAFDHALEIAGLTWLPKETVTRSEVQRPKPAPDLYLEVCRRLDVQPSQCLAVEDSPIGAKSARDAGLRVVGIARHAVDLPALKAAAHLAVQSLDPDELMRQLEDSRGHI